MYNCRGNNTDYEDESDINKQQSTTNFIPIVDSGVTYSDMLIAHSTLPGKW